MLNKTSYSKEWLQFKEAENNFVLKRKIFFSVEHSKQISDFKKAFAGDPNEVLFAISILEVLDINYEELLPILLEISIEGGEMASAYVKNLFLKYKDSSKKQIVSYLYNYLDSTNENFEGYLNIAILLQKLSYSNELNYFLERYCKHSNDENILELLTDFKN